MQYLNISQACVEYFIDFNANPKIQFIKQSTILRSSDRLHLNSIPQLSWNGTIHYKFASTWKYKLSIDTQRNYFFYHQIVTQLRENEPTTWIGVGAKYKSDGEVIYV